MPSNLILTQPDEVMPQLGPMTAFSEELEHPALQDGAYADGATTRAALAAQGRKLFRLARRLTQVQSDALRNFLLQHKVRPFWFYNLRETVPPGSWDATGQSPVGRYAVVWTGSFAQEAHPPGVPPGRGDTVSIGLREVAY